MSITARPVQDQRSISFPKPPVRLWGRVGPPLPIPPWRFLDRDPMAEQEDVMDVLDRVEARLHAASRRLDSRPDPVYRR